MTCLSLQGGDEQLVVIVALQVHGFIVKAQQTVTAGHLRESFLVEAELDRAAARTARAVEGLGIEGVPQEGGFGKGDPLLADRGVTRGGRNRALQRIATFIEGSESPDHTVVNDCTPDFLSFVFLECFTPGALDIQNLTKKGNRFKSLTFKEVKKYKMVPSCHAAAHDLLKLSGVRVSCFLVENGSP